MLNPVLAAACHQLEEGSKHPFSDPLDPALPRVAAGCYTVWDQAGRYIYAGMAGRSLTAEQIAQARQDPTRRTTGLRDRLAAHRSGRRSGDQFAIYVFDRLVLPTLSPDAIASAAAGLRQLDDDVRDFIQTHLSYRWVETPSGRDALELEAALVTSGLAGSLPYLNPRRVEA